MNKSNSEYFNQLIILWSHRQLDLHPQLFPLDQAKLKPANKNSQNNLYLNHSQMLANTISLAGRKGNKLVRISEIDVIPTRGNE